MANQARETQPRAASREHPHNRRPLITPVIIQAADDCAERIFLVLPTPHHQTLPT